MNQYEKKKLANLRQATHNLQLVELENVLSGLVRHIINNDSPDATLPLGFNSIANLKIPLLLLFDVDHCWLSKF